MSNYFSERDMKIIQEISERNSFTVSDAIKLFNLDPSRDFKFSDLSRLDFSNLDLSHFNFTGSNLEDCKFKDCSGLEKARFGYEFSLRPALSPEKRSQIAKYYLRCDGDDFLVKIFMKENVSKEEIARYTKSNISDQEFNFFVSICKGSPNSVERYNELAKSLNAKFQQSPCCLFLISIVSENFRFFEHNLQLHFNYLRRNRKDSYDDLNWRFSSSPYILSGCFCPDFLL